MAFSILDQVKDIWDPLKPAPANREDFPSGFGIVEWFVPYPPMQIWLTGNSMPHIPFEWGGELRMNEIYYPGNPEPTVQIFGSKESNLTVKGRFFDKRQPKGSKPLAAEITDVLDVIRKRGNLVKLVLGEWVRYGYLIKTSFKMRRLTSIEYELTFFIVSETEPQQNPILKGKSLPAANNERLKELQSRLLANVADYPTDFPKGPFDIANKMISDVAKTIGIVTKAVDSIITTAEQTNATLNRAVGLVAAAKKFTFNANQRIGKILLDNEVRKATLKSATNYTGVFAKAYPKVERQNVTGGFRNVGVVQKTQSSLIETQKCLTDLGTDLAQFMRLQILRRHLVKDGETLQNLAVKYYSDAEQWVKIRDHNKLRDTALVAGKVLEIPK